MSAVQATGKGPDVLVETSRALPLVSFSIALKTGSLLDPQGLSGATRMLTRWMRRTAGGRDSHVIDAEIDALGGAFGADVSPSTLTFQGTVITRSLDGLIRITGDVLARPGFAEAELERLRRETFAELTESLDDDRGLSRRWFRQKVFGQHPYARSVTGTASTVGRIQQADLKALYARIVRPENLIFAFSGDIDRARAEELAAQLCAQLPSGPAPTEDCPDPTVIAGRRLTFVDKPDRTQTQILIGGLGTHAHDDDHLALHVANTVFGGTFTARMTQEVRAKRGWSYGAYSSLPIDRRRQAFSMWTFPKAEDAAPCIKLQLEMLHDLREKGVTKKELSWAKKYLVRSHAFALDTASKRVGLLLDSALYDLPPGYYEEYIERIKAVTLEQANAAVRKRLSEDDLLVTVVGTAGQIIEPVKAAIPNLASSEVVPFDAEPS
ncbi:MAG: insulinase family protein [Myxococcales bacterium]|nr:MAG: insulinase family protein [Myxococcales bacterium]